MKDNILNITWNDILEDSRKLANILKHNRINFDCIVCVTRGGMIPATILAHELNIKYIDTVCISSYQSHQQQDIICLKPINDATKKFSNIVVIDELVDSGNTIKYIKNQLPNAYYCSLYVKEQSKNEVDLYIKQFSQDNWLNFPWENKL